MTRVQRRYRCMDCGEKFTRIYPVGSSIDDPACPRCHNQPAPTPERIAAPAIRTTKAKAIDLAWDIAQEDFKLTNMRDNAQEGETAFIPPASQPTPTPTPQNISKPEMIWGGANNNGLTLPTPAQLLQQSKGAAAIAKAEGKSPMELLHKARPRLQAQPLNRS